MKLLVLCALVGICNAVVQHDFTAALKQAVVDKHNEYRAQVAQGTFVTANGETLGPATNMRKIEWSDTLAAHAQAYANKCIWGHDGDELSQYNEGENLAAASYSSYSPESAVVAWTNELLLSDSSNPGTLGTQNSACSFQSGSVNGKAVGHATQVLWAESASIGCAWVDCSADLGNSVYRNLVVCRYQARGNFLTRSIYVPGTACSACAGNCDSDKLCTATATAGTCTDSGSSGGGSSGGGSGTTSTTAASSGGGGSSGGCASKAAYGCEVKFGFNVCYGGTNTHNAWGKALTSIPSNGAWAANWLATNAAGNGQCGCAQCDEAGNVCLSVKSPC